MAAAWGALSAVVLGTLGGQTLDLLPVPSAWGTRPPPLHEEPFRLADGPAPLTVTAGRPLLLPYCFGDCDLLATVAVPAGGELDVAVRKLDLPGAHGRFGLLRLSADHDGPPWRTREEALFADDRTGGVRVTAGLPASIRLELRGRTARANVAGRWLPPFETTDDRGAFAFVVRGGTAEVSHLHVVPLARSRGLGVLLALGALAGAGAGWLGRFTRFRLRHGIALAAWVAGAVAAAANLDRWLLPGAVVTPASIALLVLLFAIVALAIARPAPASRTLLHLASALIVVLFGCELFCRLERARLPALADPRLDLLFGLDSQQAPFDAYAKLLHGKNEVHTADPDVGRAVVEGGPTLRRIVFLGGGPLLEPGLDRAHHVALQATALAAQRLGQKLVPAVFPTDFPHTLQQTELFTRFYADVYPAACVVLGIDRWDAQREGDASARERLARADAGYRPPWSYAWAVLLRSAGAVPLATPAELGATIDAFAVFCAGRALPLVLATHAELAAPYLVAVEDAARRHELPLVRNVVQADETAVPAPLADAIAGVLRP